MSGGEFSYPAEVVFERGRRTAEEARRITELTARAEKAEAALEKAKGIMDNLVQRGIDSDVELGKYRRIVEEVTPLIDMIAAMPERPGVHRVRALRSATSRVRVFLGRVQS
ncbi:MAG TPA: hypothetical protein VE476_00170 [Propionibacteriaceae bacterium]|jgi:hypothetical protein|nr:hypothetical protein [Propionibacteriaceae bacterium]